MTVHLPLRVPLGDGVSLVIVLFAFARADLQLHPRVLKIYGQGYQRVSVTLDKLLHLSDFLFVHQEPADPLRVLVENIAFIIRGDVHTVDEQLAALNGAPCVLQIQRSGPNGLHLRAEQFNARLVFFLHEVVVVRLAVLRRDLNSLFLRGKRLLPGFAVSDAGILT